ncbi:MAG: DUF4351 domain-containing protein, partial [Planctomycetaceae bacterium]|nr:DUF4351 domain-containing protein [Planctomycetaceae bacterium]
KQRVCRNLINLTKELKGEEIMSMTIAEKYYTKATTKGKAEGKAEGIAEGIITGKVEGKAEGIAESIIRILRKRLGEPSANLQTQIMGVRSEDKLYELLDFAYTCVSFGEFSTAFN